MKTIKKILALSALCLSLSAMGIPQGEVAPISLDESSQSVTGNTEENFFLTSPTITRNGNFMTVKVDFDFDNLKLKTNQAAIFTPLLINGNDTVCFKPVGIYGKTAWIQVQRGILKTVPFDDQIALKYSGKPEKLAYEQNIPYENWMNGSSLMMRKDFYGCASCNEGRETSEQLVGYMEIQETLKPNLIYIAAVDGGVKSRELSGRAYVDFPVNKIVIYPDYRNNTYELGKIIATIDSVKNDPDISVTSIHIAGTASPEGPYDNNVYLAKNRTLALKEYVTNLYKFPKDFIQTDYDPVDWKGLREWLENNNINHKEEILAIVNSSIPDYERNSKIMKDFPKEYEWLHRNVYPALRHSDYRIEYQIREYVNLSEIAEIIKTKPQKLSLSEMYRLAASLEPGTDDYNEIFEIAVRMYPNDEIANLNAANNALSRGDLNYAEKYLEKAGNSPEAIYARGILKGMQGDFQEALKLIEQARDAGLQGTEQMLNHFKN